MKSFIILILAFSIFIIPSFFQVEAQLEPTITIQTDKQDHYIDDPIFVNGTISDVDWSKDITITYHVERGDKIIQTGNINSLQNDGTFEFIIDTSTWDTDSGSHPLEVNIQNITARIGIDYHNTPNMSPEVLYEMDMEQNEMLEQHDTIMEDQQSDIDDIQTDIDVVKTDMVDQQTDITDIKTEQIVQNQTLTEQQGVIDIIWGFLEEWLGPPAEPADAPIITLLVADDPDDGDMIYSNGDTIIIVFDSDTNEQGGTGIQTKSNVDNLFTFTELLGQDYSGQWVAPGIFVITANDVTNSNVMLGITTVTPAGTTPILSADGTSVSSSATSPVLSGNFGEVQSSIDEPQCGMGMELIDGYCFLIK